MTKPNVEPAKWIAIGFILVIILAAVAFLTSTRDHVQLHIGDKPVNAKVADSPTERTHGLSGTKELRDGEAMLFIFDSSERWGIWMKDMEYSIDIVWLDENKQVIDIETNVAPETYPTTFTPDLPARYVVELPAGHAQAHQIKRGTLASFRTWLW